MQRIVFDMSISRDQFLAWYRGSVKLVSVNARDGRRIQFPANILQPYVSHTGIEGTFAIYFDQQNKFQKIEKLS